MSIFYIIICTVSAVAFTADCILRYMEKIKSFDLEGKLFKVRKSTTIPLEKFLPENLTMLLFSTAIAGALGIVYHSAGLPWYLSLPSVIMSGLFVTFAVQFGGFNFVDFILKTNLPKGDDAADLDGYCTEFIEEGGWGKVKLFHKDREYEVNAVCALPDCEIDEGLKVICVCEQDGFYFVLLVDDVHKNVDK
jgi:hypothetical protein